GSALSAARPPATKPDRRRKPRRSRVPTPPPAMAASSAPCLLSRVPRFVSIFAPPLLLQRLVAVRSVKGLYVRAVGAITRAGFLPPGIVGLRFADRRARRRPQRQWSTRSRRRAGTLDGRPSLV